MPLRSTRTEVEAILGQPDRDGGSTYQFGNEIIDIHYAKGICEDDTYRVARDTVISIDVNIVIKRLSPKAVFAELQMDEKQFNVFTPPEAAGVRYYEAYDEGIFIDAVLDDGYERVISVRYGPTAKDATFRCPGYPKPVVPRCTHTNMRIMGPTERVSSGEKLEISVLVTSVGHNLDLKYKWTVSAGNIVSGDGTPTINIDTAGLTNQHLTVKVEIDGMPEACPNTAEYRVQIVSPSRKPIKSSSNQPRTH